MIKRISLPHPVVLLFIIIILAAIATHMVPAGVFERVEVDGRWRVIPDSYMLVTQKPLGVFGLFLAISSGFRSAVDIIFVVISSGIMFGVLQETQMVENSVGTFIKTVGQRRKHLIIVLMTFLFGTLGIAVGFENNIAMIPIAAIACLALGGDLMLAAGIAVGGVTVGFGLSPINPYTVGVGHQLSGLPLYSGAGLRSALVFLALAALAWYNVRYFKKLEAGKESLVKDIDTAGLQLEKPLSSYHMSAKTWLILLVFVAGLAGMLYGIFVFQWYIREISAVFLMISLAAAIAGRMPANRIGASVLKAVSVVAPGAFMVGFATTIKVILEEGQIGDTIAFQLSELLQYFPTYGAALAMTGAQSIINLFIPSGSGQALATLPVMIPAGELVGLTRQVTILAFQIGDGVTNLFNPSLGGMIAMLSLCRVPFDRWLKYILPLTGIILLVSWVFLIFAVSINWGPF
ncbi:MAG: putative ion transporter superfamily protein YfcC [Cyclobacteriaceae bacterium]|jgi:uncharacterized ion transporter superfamily protein YfcC